MAIIKKQTDFEVHPVTPDLIQAVVVDVTEPKLRQSQWGDKLRFSIVLETALLRSDGKRWVHWIHGYTPSISEKSNFARDAKKILGVNDLGDEFDPDTLIGKPVKIIIEHKKEGDQTYANHTYLSADNGLDPLRPSGDYKRKSEREETGSEYNKIAQPESTADDWMSTKVHVGQFAGHLISELPSQEAVEKLLGIWWPTVSSKPSADDKRLHSALVKAMAVFNAPKAPAPSSY